MQKDELWALCRDFTDRSDTNVITEAQAIRPDIAGMRVFDHPLLGIAAADDPLFEDLRRPGVIGPHFLPPKTWLPGAVSVISFFLPFTERVTRANLKDSACPNPEWANARWEGQAMIAALCRFLEQRLAATGARACSPSLDSRFRARSDVSPAPDAGALPPFSSNWSERHVAYVCGLGTFGLSAGLITAKGIAGRFGSVVTSLPLSPDDRPYSSYGEYCSRCGVCARRCPVTAISLEQGKKHTVCGPLVDESMIPYRPRYGCGKCQVGVPCQRQIPPRSGRSIKERL